MEVLIAMLVLAIGLLALASLQAQSLKFNHESYVRSQATILAYEIMDRMRANPFGDFTDGVTVPVVPANCADPALIASVNVLIQKCFWLLDIQGRLPSGTGTIVVNPADPSLVDVTIMWSDRENDNAADCATAGGPGGTRLFDGVNNICRIMQVWTVFP